MKPIKVFVGLSGGVDSSVTAWLLHRQGYEVIGVYMKNWSQDVGGFKCPWRQDYLAAKALAVHLGIKFKVFDFQKQYQQLVVDYMIEEYAQGLTPNPDIRCNSQIKFDLFLKTCLKQGADYIATGHYALIKDQKLFIPKDKRKDQTYFLYKIPQSSLTKVLFPLGEYTKPEVRQLALKAQLPTANRPESMGICFVGEVGLTDFLKHYLRFKPGLIKSETGEVLGKHQGVAGYTLGQRKGLGLGGGLPYYVVGKDIGKNEVYVSRDLNHQHLWTQALNLSSINLLTLTNSNQSYQIRLRHGGDLIASQRVEFKAQTIKIFFKDKIKTTDFGQSAVIYQDDLLIGGGVISSL